MRFSGPSTKSPLAIVALVYLTSTIRSQGSSPSQRLDPASGSWVCFTPHSAHGLFLGLQSFSRSASRNASRRPLLPCRWPHQDVTWLHSVSATHARRHTSPSRSWPRLRSVAPAERPSPGGGLFTLLQAAALLTFYPLRGSQLGRWASALPSCASPVKAGAAGFRSDQTWGHDNRSCHDPTSVGFSTSCTHRPFESDSKTRPRPFRSTAEAGSRQVP
jgi:hypothetical protein